jgi:hypothetical protein
MVEEEGDVEGPEGRRKTDVDVDKVVEGREGNSQAQGENAIAEGGDQREGADGKQQRHSSQQFQG